MSWGQALASLGTGLARGMATEDERQRVEAERARLRAVEQMTRERQWKRQDAADAQSAESNRMQGVMTRATMQANGIRQGKAPAATFQLPGLAPEGMSAGPVSVTDNERFTDLGDKYYLDRNATPAFQQQQEKRQAQTTATNTATAAQQAEASRRQQLLDGLPRAVRGRAGGLSVEQLERLQAGLITRDLTPATPRTPAAPKLITGNDGNMYEYRGGQLVPVPVSGMSAPDPDPDAMQPTRVPSMRGDALRPEAPGAGFSSQYQPPASQRPAAGTPSPFGGRGLFGKQKTAPPKYIEQVGALDTMDELIDQYTEVLNRAGTAMVQGKDPNLAEANAMHTQLMLVAKEAANLGVLNGPDLAIMERAIGSPTGVLQNWRGAEAIKKQLGVAKRTNATKRNILNKVYGQFPSSSQTPASREDLDDLVNQFMRNDE